MIGFQAPLRNGDTVRGFRVRGSMPGYCPKCDLALPLQYLVTEDTVNRQRTSYLCSLCGEEIVGMVRDKHTGNILRRRVHPHLKARLAERSQEFMKYAAKEAFSGDVDRVDFNDVSVAPQSSILTP